MLYTPVFIFKSGSSALLGRPTLWFIHLTVATWHIQYTFLRLPFFLFSQENGQNTKNIWSLPLSYDTKVAANGY